MSQCPKCGTLLPDDTASFCPLCNHPLLAGDGQAASETRVPWESVERLGVTGALVQTIRECLFRPYLFYGKIGRASSTKMAFVYALILGSLGGLVSAAWSYLFSDSLFYWLPWLENSISTSAYSATTLMLLPLITALQLGVTTLYFHVLLFLLRSKRQGIKATFLIICYAESTAVLNLVPLVGSVLSMAWSVLLVTAGISRVHRMSSVKAFLIILLPLLILGFMFILAVAALIGAGHLFQGLFKESSLIFR
jgi:hypothetical protein